MKLALFVLLFVVVWNPMSGTLVADEARSVNEAKRLMGEGAARLDRQDFSGALEMFKAAMDLVPNPKIDFGIGLALEGLNQNALAYEAFTRYLAGPQDDKVERWKEATQRQAALRERVVFLEVHSNTAPAHLDVNGRACGPLPLTSPVVLEPGSHTLTVRSSGRAWTQSVTGRAGERVVVRAEIVPLPQPPVAVSSSSHLLIADEPTTSAAPSGSRRVWLWAAAAFVVTGVVASAVVLSRQSEPQRVCATGLECIRAE